MLKIIRRIAFDKISNFDEIINKLLKICVFIMMRLLISLFVVCIQQTYHSKTFKKVNIITLKKIDKRDYTISKIYRSIALLNIIEKILKFIMSKKISWITKTHRLLLDTFMKCRKNRSIETTLKFLTEQIHIVWKQKTNRMIILLSLNVTNVFDTMSHVRLIHNMKKRKISRWIIDWINNFLFDRFTILAVNRKMIESFSMQIEISQKFSFFLILYLFYNVDLLKMCNKLETNTRFLEYVDDVNILIHEKNIEKNCRNLERMHKFCERWAIRHEFVFASIKYELIHFIKNSKKFDMTITIKIDSNTIQSRIDLRILNVQIYTKLKWNSHARKIQKKWRNKSWFSRNCRFSFEKRFFARFKCCTFSLFVSFSFTTFFFDTCSRIKNRKWLTNSQSYKIVVYEAFSNRFESFRSRFWKLKRTSSSSICIWINCRFKSNIAYKSRACRTSFVENASQ
jgi:hypothetical protein